MESKDTTFRFPCKSCGGQMAYRPASGDMECPYCKCRQPIDSPSIEAPEYIYDPTLDHYDAPQWESAAERTLICPSCGAETVYSAATVTVNCPYCGTRYVTEERPEDRVIAPETMIPFRIGEEEARTRFNGWAKSKFFAPKAFKNSRCPIRSSGVYIPFWTFDSRLSTTYSGQGGTDRTEHYTVQVNGKTETRTRTVTDWEPIHGHMSLKFDDFPVCATSSINKKMLRAIEPFSLKTLNVYNPAYLAGFFAERYNVGLRAGFEEAARRMESEMEVHIRTKLNYDHYRGMAYDHEHTDVRFKHVLLPIWIAAYRYKNREYSLMLNGETGRIAGEYPKSVWKIALAVLFGLLAAGGVLAFLYYLSTK